MVDLPSSRALFSSWPSSSSVAPESACTLDIDEEKSMPNCMTDRPNSFSLSMQSWIAFDARSATMSLSIVQPLLPASSAFFPDSSASSPASPTAVFTAFSLPSFSPSSSFRLSIAIMRPLASSELSPCSRATFMYWVLRSESRSFCSEMAFVSCSSGV